MIEWISLSPFVVSLSPFVVSLSPFVVSLSPFVVSLSNHKSYFRLPYLLFLPNSINLLSADAG